MPDELTEVKVFSPATLANLGCGYDVLGLAIYGPGDEIIIRKSPRRKKGITISKITGDDGKLPLEAEKNTAGIAAQAVLDELSLEGSFQMEIHKQMPFGSGLGSSAASAVGGAFAMNELLGAPLERRDLLPAAMNGESAASKAWHADNVGPCLLGGICLVRDNPTLDLIQIPSPEDLWVTVLYNPQVEILTAEARKCVPTSVETEVATSQAGHLASLISALYEADYHLMSRALVDQIAEPGRQDLIPQFEKYKERCLEAGAVGFGISGSGPSLFALAHGEISANRIANAFQYEPIEKYISKVNTQGVIRL